MKQFWIRLPIFITLTALFAYGVFFAPYSSTVFAQQPTETPVAGMFITVITD